MSSSRPNVVFERPNFPTDCPKLLWSLPAAAAVHHHYCRYPDMALYKDFYPGQAPLPVPTSVPTTPLSLPQLTTTVADDVILAAAITEASPHRENQPQHEALPSVPAPTPFSLSQLTTTVADNLILAAVITVAFSQPQHNALKGPDAFFKAVDAAMEESTFFQREYQPQGPDSFFNATFNDEATDANMEESTFFQREYQPQGPAAFFTATFNDEATDAAMGATMEESTSANHERLTPPLIVQPLVSRTGDKMVPYSPPRRHVHGRAVPEPPRRKHKRRSNRHHHLPRMLFFH